MEAKITYFSRAENDYQFLAFAYRSGRTDDAMSYISQSICERYLKHIIDRYCREMDTSAVLYTHSLRNLSKFLKKNLPDFICGWSVVLKCDGYYFSARYPGNDAVEVDQDDIEECWQAVNETRNSVIRYMENRKTEPIIECISDKIMKKLEEF